MSTTTPIQTFRYVNKGFCAPRSYPHESENTVSIIKESTNVKGLLLWDGKNLWVSVPFVEQKEFRTALGAAAKSLKITEKNKANGSEQAQRQIRSLNNQQHTEKYSKCNAYRVDDMIGMVKHIRKRIQSTSEEDVRTAVDAYKADKKSTQHEAVLVDVLNRMSTNLQQFSK